MKNKKRFVKKSLDKKAKMKLLIEGCKKMAKEDIKTAEEMKYVSIEANALLDD